jgi:hypothetical protein
MSKHYMRKIDSFEDSLAGVRFLSGQAFGQRDELGESAAVSPTDLIFACNQAHDLVGVIADVSEEEGRHFRRLFIVPGAPFEDYTMDFIPRIENFQASYGITITGDEERDSNAPIMQTYMGDPEPPQGGSRPGTEPVTEIEQPLVYLGLS